MRNVNTTKGTLKMRWNAGKGRPMPSWEMVYGAVDGATTNH